ncbi:MAG TPA: aminotransferase class V-fold PLP-dependent enzyme [Aliidongia sp.]|uniref:aminotransferase class V-fold PLP-dependent enzyme n=1 Tax=Aliidongia sp. TaxID=1914230 RepID=UPI002DDC93D4|nr:aminotransferase class V-fold PLP-dependent enzyme [Aliidongia sp.]HEV2674369.1 aminotransferase class V-fold PLP-dependent enzyme [Aliidongia sp.]
MINGARVPPDAIYLDYQATTPTDPRVVDAMMPYLVQRFGNPHSTSHAFGQEAADAVERAREQVAALIGAEAREIVFTSGATESNNLAIKGAVRFLKSRRSKLVTVATEHKCVLESCRTLVAEGCELTVLPVDRDGRLDLDRLAAAIDDRTALVSVMAVNNEIGVIQDLAAIGAIARAAGALFHTDAAQAFGKVPLDVTAQKIDLMSISGHKVYAPKGIGALYVRRRPRVRLEPLFSGGGQERGLRSGTLAPALIVALGAAAEIAGRERAAEADRLGGLAASFLDRLTEALEGVAVHGNRTDRIPGNLNVGFAGVSALALMAALPDLALSVGSACTSADVEPSYVLSALGLDDATAASAVRIGFGRFTTEAELLRAAGRMIAAVAGLRSAGLRPALEAAT